MRLAGTWLVVALLLMPIATVSAQSGQCYSSADCAPGYFCNIQYQCERSQVQTPPCPAGQCCENDGVYLNRTCADMTGGDLTACCSDRTCAVSQDACKLRLEGPPISTGAIVIVVEGLIIIGLFCAVIYLVKHNALKKH